MGGCLFLGRIILAGACDVGLQKYLDFSIVLYIPFLCGEAAMAEAEFIVFLLGGMGPNDCHTPIAPGGGP